MLNKCILVGRITKDPESATTTSGVIVTKFTIAVNRRFNREETDFINIVTFSKTAEFVKKYFTKGQAIIVSGAIQSRTYEKDGEKRYVTEVVADEVNFCGSKNESSKQEDSTFDVGEGFMPIDADDDLPF